MKELTGVVRRESQENQLPDAKRLAWRLPHASKVVRRTGGGVVFLCQEMVAWCQEQRTSCCASHRRTITDFRVCAVRRGQNTRYTWKPSARWVRKRRWEKNLTSSSRAKGLRPSVVVAAHSLCDRSRQHERSVCCCCVVCVEGYFCENSSWWAIPPEAGPFPRY